MEGERSVQHLERLVSETIENFTRQKSDKVKDAFSKIEKVQQTMKDNMSKMLNNQEEVKHMEAGSE